MSFWTRNCARCRKGSGTISVVTVQPNRRARTRNGSDAADLDRLRRVLTERYTPESLVREVRRNTDPRYIQLRGLKRATEEHLVALGREMRLDIAREDMRMIADTVVDRAGGVA